MLDSILKGARTMFGLHKKTYTAKVKISGMKCMMCVKHVSESLEAVKGIKKVEVSLSEGTANIVSSRELSDDELKSAITAAGYGYEGRLA
jgi:copper chaperone CopZ